MGFPAWAGNPTTARRLACIRRKLDATLSLVHRTGGHRWRPPGPSAKVDDVLPDTVRSLFEQSGGVVSRRRLLDAGSSEPELQRWMRRRELVRVHPGVYVDHTGPLSWWQRALAVVAYCEPAAVWGASALKLHEGVDGAHEPVIVAVARNRRIAAPAGARVVRRARLDQRVHWTRSPPVQRYDDAVVDAAVAAGQSLSSVAALTRAVRERRTTAERLRLNLESRPRVDADRDWLVRVLRDIEHGTHSVLEYDYLHRVESAHALPTSFRQAVGRTSAGRVYHDAVYGDLVVELDGRTFHDTAAARDADFERDLDLAVAGVETRRLGASQAPHSGEIPRPGGESHFGGIRMPPSTRTTEPLT